MLPNINFPISGEYRTGSKNEPYKFYMDALLNSSSLDLLLGYFSSSAINILSFGFAYFLHNGGKVRMIINHILNQKDYGVLQEVQEGKIENYSSYLENFELLNLTLDEYGIHFFKCLAWLIANKRIEIVIVRPLENQGISHYKSGVFFDGKDKIKFKASCNFTANGLVNNLEELEVKLSWESLREQRAIEEQDEYFENIFKKKAKFVDYIKNQDIIIQSIEKQFGNIDLEDLIKESSRLRKKKEILIDEHCKELIEEIENKILTGDKDKPKFPYKEGPRDYQLSAYSNWASNYKQGIFAMATGTGKTITSLNCLLNEYKERKVYQAVIIVPTIALVNQWEDECKKFNFDNIIKVNSKEKWTSEVSLINTAKYFGETSFIIIVTYSSFYRKKFQSYFQSLPNETLLIGDEVHNLGTPKLLEALPKIHLRNRIGLSATPNRYYDDKGNKEIETFFNDEFPYTYRLTMKEALDRGWLCSYTYFPHLVELDSEELASYIKISLQLMKYFDMETNSYKKAEEVEMLLMIRKRIIHKAKNKLGVFNKILKEEYRKRGNLEYTLVYVPEGVNPNYEEIDNSLESEEEAKLIDDYTRMVSKIDFSILVKQYTAKTKDRNEIVKNFEKGKIHVLTSMKCLDEGVDIPKSQLAIFCASTGNPRQFIQRRGRVLRRHTNKTHAVIHDLVVVPSINRNDATYNMERSLVKKELERVIDFSSLALNNMDTYNELEEVLNFYKLSLYEQND